MIRRLVSPVVKRTVRWQSTLASMKDPSLDELSAMLSGRSGVTEILSDEIVKIRTCDGMGIGSTISFLRDGGKAAQGVVIQFDSKTATVALTSNSHGGSISRSSDVQIENERIGFNLTRVPFECNSVFKRGSLGFSTGIPVADMLLGPFFKTGSTTAIYSSSFHPKEDVSRNTIKFPSKQAMTTLDLYLDLINQAKKALTESREKAVVFVCDFRKLEDACRSLEFQAGTWLPVNPQSLVASVLQMAHDNLSVISFFNNSSDFVGEASRSVDVGIELAGQSDIANLRELLVRFSLNPQNTSSLHGQLIQRIVEGLDRSKELGERRGMGVYVDFWDEEEGESISSLIKLLPYTADLFASTTHVGERMLLLRALTVLFFDKTTKRHSAAIANFPKDLLTLFRQQEGDLLDRLGTQSDTLDLDSALMKHRYHFELTNPL